MFYFVCALVALLCLIALGFGPVTFVLAAVSLAVLAFRSRLRRWWGLPAAAAGIAFAAAVTAGWGWRQVVEATVLSFVVIAAVRIAGRATTRRLDRPDHMVGPKRSTRIRLVGTRSSMSSAVTLSAKAGEPHT